MARHAPTIPAGGVLLDAATILLAALTALAAFGLREAAPQSCVAPAPALSAVTVARERPAPPARDDNEAKLRDLASHD